MGGPGCSHEIPGFGSVYKTMKSTKAPKGVLTACKPRQEVLEGELDDAIFAADFGQLIDGSAPKVYGHAETFFRNTEPTPDLKSVC
jgi:hypothetical protein